MAGKVRPGQAGPDNENVRTGNVRSRLGRLGRLKVRISQIMSRQNRPKGDQVILDLFISGKVTSSSGRSEKVRICLELVW